MLNCTNANAQLHKCKCSTAHHFCTTMVGCWLLVVGCWNVVVGEQQKQRQSQSQRQQPLDEKIYSSCDSNNENNNKITTTTTTAAAAATTTTNTATTTTTKATSPSRFPAIEHLYSFLSLRLTLAAPPSTKATGSSDLAVLMTSFSLWTGTWSRAPKQKHGCLCVLRGLGRVW